MTVPACRRRGRGPLGQLADLGQAGLVPTGLAPARHSLMPLYRAGLWLAVIIAPGMPRLPLA